MYGIIPNYVLIAGYAGIIPIMYKIYDWRGIFFITVNSIVFLAGLFMLYMVRCIGAGDVTLLTFICGVFGRGKGLRFLVIVFVIGAVMGAVKLISKITKLIGEKKKIRWERTGIRFSIPVLVGYLAMLALGGGAV